MLILKNKLSKYLSIFGIISSFTMIFVSGNRSSLVSVVIILFVYFSFRYINYNRLTRNLFFILVLLIPTLAAYMLITGSGEIAVYIKSVSEALSGKERLLSSRGIIWLSIIEEVKRNPILGLGPSTVPNDIMNTTLSSHNLYLQVALQSGILGLSVLIYLLWYVWNSLCHYGTSSRSAFSAACLMGFMFHQIFEVSLMQNNIPAALCMWVIITFGYKDVSVY
ncbi:O-antigen ligase family protein [Salinibacter sp.]|uniref:O-antigen ligase family protein n=1 Tax=Salinibacter sp. TaxID=2065818 RepID=UPI003D704D19